MISAKLHNATNTYRMQSRPAAKLDESRTTHSNPEHADKLAHNRAPAEQQQHQSNSDHAAFDQSLAQLGQGAAAFGSSLTEAQLAEVIARQALPTVAANASTSGKALAGNSPGVGSGGSNGANPALEKITQQFKDRFAGQAANKDEFHALMKKSFGGKYDVAAAENIRQQTLKGDFSWMPKIEVVDAAALKDTSGTQGDGVALGAFSKDTNTVYLNRELLNTNPAKAEKVLTEEVGHSIDSKINKTDAAGDEGAIFSRLSHGENISAAELKTLRAENDSGTIVVNGKKMEVEYGFLKKLKNKVKGIGKKIKNKVKSIGKKIKKGLSKAWSKVKSVVKKVLTSKILGYVLAVARFIPIPIVQAIVTVANMARAAYSVYQGVKNKSWGAVLGGVAGLAGGVAKFGGSVGLSQGALNTASKIATHAGNASKAYTAMSQKNFGTAAALASNYFGATSPLGKAFDTAAKVDKVYQAARSDNPLSALSAGANLLQDYTGPAGDKTLQSIAKNADAFGQVQKALKADDYAGVLSAANDAFGDKTGLSPSARRSVEQFTNTVGKLQDAQKMAKRGNYLGAGQALLGQAAALSGSDATRQKLESVGQVMLKVDAAAKAIEGNRFDEAASLAADALGNPLDDKTKSLLSNIQNRAKQAIALKDAVESRDINQASALLGELTNGSMAGVTDQFSRIKGFADNATALRNALDTRDYGTAATLASKMASSVAGKDNNMARTLDTLADILGGKVQVSLGDLFPGNGATPGINPAAKAA